jgi:hypothetical protein
VPDRGEIQLEEATKDTVLHCRIWYLRLLLRRSLLMLLVGLVVGMVSSTRLSLSVSAGVAVVVTVVLVICDHLVTRGRLRRSIEAYIHNTTYLKAM